MRRAILLLLLCGCSSEPSGPPLLYDLSIRPVLPFPTDLVAVADDTPTGARLAFGAQRTNLGDVDEALFLMGEDFVESLERTDGWSTLGPAFAPIGQAADPTSVQDHFLVIDLEAKQILETVNAVLTGETDYSKRVHWVSARSYTPLRPKTKHAIILRRGLKTEAGEAFSRPESFDAVWNDEETTGKAKNVKSARDRLRPLPDLLGSIGIAEEDVLVAETFTTLSIDEQMKVLLDAIHNLPTPEVTLDADGDGSPDVYDSPRLDPRGNVPSRDYPQLRALVRARFEIPNYRLSVDEEMVIDYQSVELQSWEQVEVLMLLPHGQGPHPVVVFHHGVGSDKEDAFRYAEPLLDSGIVVAAIDGPLHGYRTNKPGNAATRFLNIGKPSWILDNFRQAEADQVYFVRVLDQLAAMDILQDGTQQLDTSRLFYLGESLGSIVGAAVVGIEPRFQGAALMVGGGTLFEFFDRVLSGFQFEGFPTQLFTTVAQTGLDRGDPTNYARHSKDKQILLIQSMEDGTIPSGASISLARAMELPLVEPYAHLEMEGITRATAPVERRGWTQYTPAGHGLPWNRGEEHYAEARAQWAHFIDTWAKTGVAEIR